MDKYNGKIMTYDGNQVDWKEASNPLLCTPTALFDECTFRQVKFWDVKASSEQAKHRACNMGDRSASLWKPADFGNDRINVVDFRLEGLSRIDAIHMFNSRCCSVAFMVGNSRQGDVMGNKMLLRRDFRDFYHESDMVVGYATDKSHFFWEKNDDFKPEIHAQKWDLVRIICYQPYPIDMEYGLGFVEFAEDISDY